MSGEQDLDSKCGLRMSEQCPFHGVEIERRKNTQKEMSTIQNELRIQKDSIDDMKIFRASFSEKVEDLIGDLDKAAGHIGGLLTFKNLMIGCSFLGMLVITGSFLYTYIHTAESANTHNLLLTKIDNNTQRINELRTDQARIDERYTSLTNQLQTANERLTAILDYLRNKGKKEVDLDDFDHHDDDT